MKVIFGIGKVKQKYNNPVVAIGVFDGLHKGHQQLIRRTIKKAHELKGTAVVITFHPHPVHILRPDIYLPLIVSLPLRIKLIEQIGADICLVIHFTKSFSKLSAQQFVKKYLVDRLRVKEVFVGDDFRFGHEREGDLTFFKSLGEDNGFKVNIIRSVRESHQNIGSTLIRKLIIEGKLDQARRLLGRSVSLMGRVIRGDSRGKILGFPTANINPTCEVIPPCGVYAVNVWIKNKLFYGMANVGRRPSFHKTNNPVNVEVHIFDFEKNIYGQHVIIEFIKKIREEKIFYIKDELIAQLKKDEFIIKKAFKKMH